MTPDNSLHIRRALDEDFGAIWPIFHSVVSAGETYAYAPQTSAAEAKRLWLEAPDACYVALGGGEVLGTYYLKANQPGLGAHVCNAGYMVAAAARGRGVGRALCLHSQTEAQKLGFKAMQFNLVAATNTGALQLWRSLGFVTVGRLPGAFKHERLGYVDAFVMYKWLAPEEPTAV